MAAERPAVDFRNYRSDAHSWAMAARAPDPRLKPYVSDYTGYSEQASQPMRRLQPPFAGIPMIVTFGPAIDIINGDRPAERGMFRSFLAGLHDVHVLTEFAGAQRGLQVNFTLLGAHRFLDAAMTDVANRCLDLGDIIGASAASLLSERLQDAKDWPARFDLMDRFLLERLARGRPMSPDIAWALRQLQAERGARSIGALSRALACSRKTLIKRFHAQIGLTPKAVAGILRFEHAAGRLRAGDEESWTELALSCGYSDQAHFNRDFRRYSGRTPTEYRRALMPNGGGIAG
jgi:AraC-like DNA-binding protein